MMRRSFSRFAVAVAGKEISDIASDKVLANDPNNKQTADVGATVSSSSQRIDTVTSSFVSPLIDPRPDASEAPHLLAQESFKPFISANKIRNFSASLGVGVVSVATVYYLLSKQVADHFEEEAKLMRKLEEDASRARRTSHLQHFVAPSSFAMLQKKMIEEEKLQELGLAKHQQNKTSVVLHQEFLLRLKARWNKMVQDGQDSMNILIMQYNNYRDEQMKAVMMGVLEMNGLKVISMEQDKY
eukprot:Tbor_TRINITY_DN5010_c5_g6::TRINITY_DN5010_c5_g6_i1::g.14106::m.14106